MARRRGFIPPVEQAIQAAAQRSGLPIEFMRGIARIESGGRPSVQTGSYKGLYQLSDQQFRQYGGGQGSVWNPTDNANAAANKFLDMSRRFQREFGRAPSMHELYMLHQQGEGGARAHFRNPDAPAWQNMASTGEGRQKGAGWAKRAIWGNIPTQERRRFGSVDNVTSRDFSAMWARLVANRSEVSPQVASTPIDRVAQEVQNVQASGDAPLDTQFADPTQLAQQAATEAAGPTDLASYNRFDQERQQRQAPRPVQADGSGINVRAVRTIPISPAQEVGQRVAVAQAASAPQPVDTVGGYGTTATGAPIRETALPGAQEIWDRIRGMRSGEQAPDLGVVDPAASGFGAETPASNLPGTVVAGQPGDFSMPSDASNFMNPAPQATEVATASPSANTAPATASTQPDTLGSIFSGSLLEGWQVGTPILGHIINQAFGGAGHASDGGAVAGKTGGGLFGGGRGGGFRNPIPPASVPAMPDPAAQMAAYDMSPRDQAEYDQTFRLAQRRRRRAQAA